MKIRSRAPLRLSLGGGGTDIPPYTYENGGAVLNSTINRYVYATLIPNNEKKFKIRSIDFDVSLEKPIDEELIIEGQLSLVKGVIKHFKKNFGLNKGFELFIFSDAPPGTGAGSSSALAVTLVSLFSYWMKLNFTFYDIARLAYKIERKEVKIAGGMQDQYASSFGGFNFIEFRREEGIVNPLRIEERIINELECNIILAYINKRRFSSDIISRQIKNYKNMHIIEALNRIKKNAYEMKNLLLLGKIKEMGELLHESWIEKKKLAEGITNELIDKIYSDARKAGAIGGKISGAGGGGYMFFIVEQEKRFEVINSLKKNNCEVVPFSFTKKGVTTWQVI